MMEHPHTFYLAMSYGATLVAIVVEVIALKLRRARAVRGVEEERELETQD
jgi:heme exporter protein CcmD